MCSPDAFTPEGGHPLPTTTGEELATRHAQAQCTCPPGHIDTACLEHGYIRVTRDELTSEVRATGGCTCPPQHVDPACPQHGYLVWSSGLSTEDPAQMTLPPLPEQVPVTYHKGSTHQRIGTAHLTQDRRGIYAHIELDHQGLDIEEHSASFALHSRTVPEQMTYLAEQLEQGANPVVISMALRVCAEMQEQSRQELRDQAMQVITDHVRNDRS